MEVISIFCAGQFQFEREILTVWKGGMSFVNLNTILIFSILLMHSQLTFSSFPDSCILKYVQF